MVVRVEEKTTLVNSNKMCSFGAMYMDEDSYLQEKEKDKFYKKQSENWDYYSGLPNPKAYESRED